MDSKTFARGTHDCGRPSHAGVNGIKVTQGGLKYRCKGRDGMLYWRHHFQRRNTHGRENGVSRSVCARCGAEKCSGRRGRGVTEAVGKPYNLYRKDISREHVRSDTQVQKVRRRVGWKEEHGASKAVPDLQVKPLGQ